MLEEALRRLDALASTLSAEVQSGYAAVLYTTVDQPAPER